MNTTTLNPLATLINEVNTPNVNSGSSAASQSPFDGVSTPSLPSDPTPVQDTDDGEPLKWKEVWRPATFLPPTEDDYIIVRTRNNSFFPCRIKNGEYMRKHHGVWVPVAEPVLWIPMPYATIPKYLNNGTNKDIPIEVTFAYLLREKHQLESQLNNLKPLQGNQHAVEHLQKALATSESKSAKLVSNISSYRDEISQLKQLLNTRNIELDNRDNELNECYASISDLKHQLKEANLTNADKIRYEAQLLAHIEDKKKLTKQLQETHEEELRYIAETKRLASSLASKESELKQLRINNDKYKAERQHYIDRYNALRDKTVVPQITADAATYIAKYNLLSTRYTRMRNFAKEILNHVKNLANNGNPLPRNEYDAYLLRFNNLTQAEPEPTVPDASPAVTPGTCAAVSTAPLTPPASTERQVAPLTAPAEKKPRLTRIPRDLFLRIPHIGNGTLVLIEPLLKRFNIIID